MSVTPTCSSTAQGLVGPPVLSRGGAVHRQVQGIGQLKASPNGRRLALAVGTINPQQTQGIPSVELLDFDPSTGRLTNPVVLPPARIACYGLEFSPDGTRLYVSDPFLGMIFQYDLTAANVAASVVQLSNPSGPGQIGSTPSALQLGPDGRIYAALTNTTAQAVGVITEPNRLGVAFNYVPQGVGLNGRRPALGLPSFMQRDLWHFTVRGTCQGSPISFAFPAIYGADSVRWNFGDLAAGRSNTATSNAPTHVYGAPGRYLVALTLYLPGAPPAVLRRYVDVSPLPVIILGRDTALCPGQAVVLNAAIPAATYRWQDGSTAATLRAQRPGWYWVDVTSAAGCTARDSLHGVAAAAGILGTRYGAMRRAGADPTAPPGGYAGHSLPLVRRLHLAVFGGHHLRDLLAGSHERGRVQPARFHPRPLPHAPRYSPGTGHGLVPDPERPFTLDATLPGVRYRWQDGSTQSTFAPSRSGTYWVTVSTPVCSATDSIQVRLYDCREQVFVPNIITPNGDGRNDRFEIVGLGSDAWSLTVFSRWGQRVYTTPHYRQEWDAVGLVNGVYYYWLQEPGSRRQLKGWVEVAR